MPLAEIHVTLKPALFDAQGETIKKALHQLGHSSVQSARIGKFITLEIEGENSAALQGQLDLMCQQLLANPVIEDYQITFATLASSPSLANQTVAFDPIRDEQTVPTPPTVLEGAPMEAVMTSRTSGGAGVAASVANGIEAVTTSGGIGISDPFTVDFRSYEGMPTEAKLALRTLALRKHGAWIQKQLAAQGAAWILCIGQEVSESGATLDTYPSDQHLLKLGVARDLVPWVFTRPSA
ncbi:phosphoribosylformylglycinamidine synthase, purS protein [Abditibacterium utsteinense]|uniref:Phosphoribosylformylglycinamidine synthase subunit PurS n=1 Tax=Abditibacterium utsteinense TaxID=1960156 RepID=A0A2S8SQ10_9BACT|nr:phosphoribosylformylglycinamidine synthase subunit PurS [Abditibacterium utsteinense]PQV62885.1 phosphoribosylformylglycinamidine synthase, purS protein [Abditibacterium utsteinense]